MRYAILVALSTLVLICLGGLVTSKGVGMAVPDWPTSYGYNMFFLPLEQWWGIGGIHDEHLHRLVASSVGGLTVVLALWLQLRGPGRLVKQLGWMAVGLVIFQGVLGGLRVVLDKEVVADWTLGMVFGLAHACTGQAFFVLLCVLGLLLSSTWLRSKPGASGFWLPWLGVGLIFTQLVLGALMRHQHAGLAIPDFPLAYDQLWPATDAESLLRYNQVRTHESLVTPFQIHLQMLHRAGAVAAVITVIAVFLRARRRFGVASPVAVGAMVWTGLLVTQFLLGAATIWTAKSADVATAHVALGALSLAVGTLLALASRRQFSLSLEPQPGNSPAVAVARPVVH